MTKAQLKKLMDKAKAPSLTVSAEDAVTEAFHHLDDKDKFISALKAGTRIKSHLHNEFDIPYPEGNGDALPYMATVLFNKINA